MDHTIDLRALWDARLETALEAAARLYAPLSVSLPTETNAEEQLTPQFGRVLTTRQPTMPESDQAIRRAVLAAVWLVIEAVRAAPAAPFVEDYIAVALRPVRRLRAGELTSLICQLMHDFHTGLWNPHLTRPQLWVIQISLTATIYALPPDEMGAFWEALQSPDPMMRGAMALGLTALRDAHAVPHLLRGLEQSRDHDTRAAIVNALEQIADPRSLADLARIRRDTATADWTLSRQIARAIRVIEQQNRGLDHRTLLRAASSSDRDLLRMPADTPRDYGAELLRPDVTKD